MTASRRRSTLALLAALALGAAVAVGCGGGEEPAENPPATETGSGAPGTDTAAEDAASTGQGAATEADSPEAEERPGHSEVEVTGALETGFTGSATFAAGRGDFALDIQSPQEDRFLKVQGSQVFEEVPAEGEYAIGGRSRAEPGWNATLLDARPEAAASGGSFIGREGTLRLTSVTPERIDGEIDFTGSNPRTSGTIRVSATFSATCNTLTGSGRCW